MASNAQQIQLVEFHESLEDGTGDEEQTHTVELPAFVYTSRALKTNDVAPPEGDCLEAIIDNELYMREWADGATAPAETDPDDSDLL